MAPFALSTEEVTAYLRTFDAMQKIRRAELDRALSVARSQSAVREALAMVDIIPLHTNAV